MPVKLNPTKVTFVIDLLKSNSNRFTPAQLESVTGSPRRARSALFHARLAGVKLEAIRDSGRAVTAYVFSDGTLPTIAAKPVKAAKAASAKAAVKAKTISKEVDAVVAKNKAPSKKAAPAKVAAKVVADTDVKAKNLATMRAVTAKHKSLDTIESRLTAEQKAIREQFYADEAEAERENREFARASVREYLKKETYAE